jgi:hypothetical protein
MRTCSICSNPRVREIDAALAEGVAYRTVAKRFGASGSSVFRHGKEHLPTAGGEGARMPVADKSKPVVRQAVPAQSSAVRLGRIASADAVNYLVRIQRRTLSILETATAEGRQETALKAIRESRENLGMIAKLSGMLRDGGDARSDTVDLRRLSVDELGSLLRASVGEMAVRDRRTLLLEAPELIDLAPDLFESASD